MLFVDDVVARRKVFKDPDSCRTPGTGPASGPAASGQLGLGDYGQPGSWEDEAAFHGGHDQRGAWILPHLVTGHRDDLHPGVAEASGQLIDRAASVGGHHHPVSVGQEAAETARDALSLVDQSVTSPSRGNHGLYPWTVRNGVNRPDRCSGVDQQAFPFGVQAGEGRTVGPPGGGQRGSQLGLLGP